MIEMTLDNPEVTLDALESLAVEIAERLRRSRDVVVLLRMPHCEPILASRQFGLHPELIPVAGSAEEVLTHLRRAATAGMNGDRVVLCFCREMTTMLALRPEDCTHESDFEDFCFDRNQGTLSGFGFYFDHAEAGVRIYRVAKVHSRLHWLRETGDSFLRGLVEVRVVASEALRLTVEAAGDENSLEMTVAADGGVIFKKTLGIDRSGLGAYITMEKALRDVIDNPADAAKILEVALGEIKRSDRAERMYPTCEDIKQDILADSSKTMETARGLLAALFDGPVAGTYARRQLGRILAGNGPIPLPPLSRAVEADLARLRLRLDTLEATDPVVSY